MVTDKFPQQPNLDVPMTMEVMGIHNMAGCPLPGTDRLGPVESDKKNGCE